MSETIHQEVSFKAAPQRIYEALMDSRQHAAFTANGDATISREAGGAFSAHGGFILGRNIELIPYQRIVQAWRVKSWPEGIYSVVKFELSPQGGETRLTLDHTGIPAGESGHLATGWPKMYWEKLAAYLT